MIQYFPPSQKTTTRNGVTILYKPTLKERSIRTRYSTADIRKKKIALIDWFRILWCSMYKV